MKITKKMKISKKCKFKKKCERHFYNSACNCDIYNIWLTQFLELNYHQKVEPIHTLQKYGN